MSKFNEPQIKPIVGNCTCSFLTLRPDTIYHDYSAKAQIRTRKQLFYVFSFNFVSIYIKVKEGQVMIMVENWLYMLVTIEETS